MMRDVPLRTFHSGRSTRGSLRETPLGLSCVQTVALAEDPKVDDIKHLLANSLQKKAQSEEDRKRLQNIIWQRHKVRQMDINRY